MKKDTLKAIYRRKRLAKYRANRRLRFYRRIRKTFNKPIPQSLPSIIEAPKYLELRNKFSHNKTCAFIDAIRHRAIDGHPIKIDFSKTELVYPCGTVLFFAELDRLHRIFGKQLIITANYPNNLNVEKVFQQIGLLRLLGLADRQVITEEDKHVYYWQAATGTTVDPLSADPVFMNIKSQLPQGYKNIVRGVEEAMTNVVHHAYELPRNDRLDDYPATKEKRWWIFAEVLDNWLYIVMCDLGIGIPRSLTTTWKDAVADIMSLQISQKQKHIALVRRAFTLGKSRTEQNHRGKGLDDIRKAASVLTGRLSLTTNRVNIGYDYTAATPVKRKNYYSESIMGTIIQWSIPLSGKVRAPSKGEI